MNKEATILITGAYGFIGSCLVGFLNQNGFKNLILSDAFDDDEKELNLLHKEFLVRVERDNLFEWLQREKPELSFVFHLGARTDTTEFDYRVHQKLNVEFSQQIWNYCTVKNIPMVYASSAATYGEGEFGYDDSHELVEQLQPLNPYGISKNEFDKWVLHQTDHPPFWAGLKFFNVYGPNEYHKGRMASVIYHSFNRIMETGKARLFRSHKAGYADGEQLRDFVYVKDLLQVMFWMMENKSTIPSGLYNLGTGLARSFNDLVKTVFTSMNKHIHIDYIDMPEDIRERYQYFTEATMDKLHQAGYTIPFYSLEEGIGDYVKNYLGPNKFY